MAASAYSLTAENEFPVATYAHEHLALPLFPNVAIQMGLLYLNVLLNQPFPH